MSSTPSTFARVLQRSSFASFDPNIAQAYTTHGGHAHRGDWGLKRPLALTKARASFRFIPDVDSKEQQTVWHNAEHPVRWLKSFTELGVDVWVERHAVHSTYSCRSNDSDFLPAVLPYEDNSEQPTREGDHVEQRSVRARRFLERVREQRPQFVGYVAQRLALTASATRTKPSNSLATNYPKDKSRPIDKLRNSDKPDELFYWCNPAYSEGFLSWRNSGAFRNPKTRRLIKQSHAASGITYTAGGTLTNRFLHRPVPGRILQVASTRLRSISDRHGVVGVGGVAVKLYDTPGGSQMIDNKGQTVLVTPKAATLRDPPRVVGRRDGRAFDQVQVETDATWTAALSSMMSNSYVPGSRLYVAHTDHSRTVRLPESIGGLSPSPHQQATSKTMILEDLDGLYDGSSFPNT